FLTTYDDYIIISNDDVQFLPGTIEALVNAAEKSPEDLFFYPHSAESGANAWSMFLQRKALQEKIGLYDETFFPAYFEDDDYSLRMRKAGIRAVPVVGAGYVHFASSTIQAYTPEQTNNHHASFRRNRSYYIVKWGGDP